MTERERHTGKYALEGNLERICRCGHTLGQHAAETTRTPEGKRVRDCLWGTGIGGDEGTKEQCKCVMFK